MKTDIILITGASRGLGFSTAEALLKEGYKVIMTGGNLESLKKAAEKLKHQQLLPELLELDVSDIDHIKAAQEFVEKEYGRLDCLINNAGVIVENEYSFETIPRDTIIHTINNNALGPLSMIQNFSSLLAKSQNPRIVNVSSGMGSLTDMGSGTMAYRLSKACLNVISIQAQHELADQKIRTLTVCPGWVKTDMGGANATRELSEGIAGILWAAKTGPEGPSAGFFRDGKPIPW